MAILGHANVSTTHRYTQIVDKEKEDAVDLLDDV